MSIKPNLNFKFKLNSRDLTKKVADLLREQQMLLNRVCLLLFATYFLASLLSAFIMSSFLSRSLRSSGSISVDVKDAAFDESALNKKPNYRNIQKAILKRNIFNSEGKLPDETSADSESKKALVFDAKAPCKKPSIDIELIGTIYMGKSVESLAVIKEKGFEEPDIYKVGESLIDHDDAKIFSIERQMVVLNNAGSKECLELVASEKALLAERGESGSSGMGGGGSGEYAQPASTSTCLLESSYVEKELGPGFGKIINAARLVPNTVNNAINGFKIFAIDPSSLFGKVGLQNGDIITQVNEVSLKQPEQGFALYQAFQEEKDVRIHVLRGEQTPVMIQCQVK